ncbi:carbohydrate ABC transporter permease [Pseudonocardia abyssalis]|uniref:Carbohydrate ABC transporter permease n=1 Tax=Pseudonocardia abyssalis TaxID=2792008 RepID=A0ABS6UKW4_9PSEU|nr:carbohydrate ABC transporter permease [Pseudonocardia abyssalis]MBW0116999.1 carbohydrate ABC transporter permease [Pseudonocardia abyssalis]MBW0132906.1 carbohydrate ABC transporter permease [Pseudonocardia abyssalis]
MRGRSVAGTWATYVVLVVGAVLVLAPFVLSLSTALKTPRQFAAQSVLAPPAPPVADNFVALFGEQYDFTTPIAVTVQVVAVILVGQLLFSVFAAYAFARLRFRGRDTLFWVYLATLMVPQAVTIIPLYLMMTEAGLRNTFWALVLPQVFGSPYAIFLLREYFRGIPSDLLDAAKLDGAGTLRILFSIVLPMSRPIIATLVVITVVTHWNNFLWPLVITSGPTWQVLTVATSALQTQYNGNWTIVMAATTIAIVPLLVLFLAVQRNVVRSITITGFR